MRKKRFIQAPCAALFLAAALNASAVVVSDDVDDAAPVLTGVYSVDAYFSDDLIPYKGSTTLIWQSTADVCYITGVGSLDGTYEGIGNLDMTLSQSTTAKVRCDWDDVIFKRLPEDTAYVEVEASDEPDAPVVSFDVSPRVNYSDEFFQFSWSSQNAASCRLHFSETDNGLAQSANGDFRVKLAPGLWNTRMSCTGAGGTVDSETITIRSLPVGEAPTVDITSWYYNNGTKRAQINYQSVGANRCTYAANPIPLNGYTFVDIPYLPFFVTISCQNEWGWGNDTVQIRIAAQKPPFLPGDLR